MPEITARLSTALADRYKIERHLGEGGGDHSPNFSPNFFRTEELRWRREPARPILVMQPARVVAM